MNRCYSKNRNISLRAYEGCVVSDDWHNFQTFSKWYSNKINIFKSSSLIPCLDKDLLSSNVRGKLYSPDTCALIPSVINQALIEINPKKSILPPGVNLTAYGKYQVNMKINSCQTYLGVFDSSIEAAIVYQLRLQKYIKELAIQYKEVLEDRAFDALMNWKPKQDYLIN